MASDGCVTKYVWQKINDSINDTVNQIMLDELIQESKLIRTENVKIQSAASNRQTKILINKNITEYTKKMEEIK